MTASFTPTSLTENLPALSSLPAILNELERALNDPASSVAQYSKIIEKDPDLTARILRMANSAFYGLQSRVETVVQALSIIGVDELKDLLNGGTVVEYFQNIPADLMNMKSFWQHSVACGIAAKELAIQKRAPEPERFFVAGLIHAIGRLVLLLKEPDSYRQVLECYQNNDKALYLTEEEMLGFQHTAVAASLLRNWRFPSVLINAVENQHNPNATASAFLEASIIHLADFLVTSMNLGNGGENGIPVLNTFVFDRLNFSEKNLQTTMNEVDRQFDEVMDLFI